MHTVRNDVPNRAYGSTASDWARRLPAGVPIVTSDLPLVAHAFADAANRRKRGETFCASVFIDDPQARSALFIAAPPILSQVSDYDQRYGLLNALALGTLVIGGQNQRDIEHYDPRLLRSTLEFLVTADVVVTRSSVERERLCRLIGRRFLHMTTVAPPDPAVPRDVGLERQAGAIVVWAPGYPAEACGILAYALEEFMRPAIIICAPGQPAAMRAGTRYIDVADAPAALAQAAVIVDASLSDPGSARALARWGVPLAVTSCSGALDWLDGITVFDPWNHRSIATAVANAIGYRAPYERDDEKQNADLERALARAAAPVAPRCPLVSVIVPTMNRRATLHDALASIIAQSYPQVEIVLVNDGGPSFIDRPFAGTRALQVVEYPDNRGVTAALNAGIAASRGKYIAALADDDLFCPDHLTRLVAALERTAGDVAHAIELGEHFDRQLDEAAFSVVGHSLIAGEPATPTTLQTANVIGGPAMVFTRAAFDRVGPFDDRAGHLIDFEMWLRMSADFEFIHVDRVTAVMSLRTDTSQLSAISGTQTAQMYRAIYDLHPSARPWISSNRERHLIEIEAIPQVHSFPQLRIS